ncbi:MAG: beta-galactosidase [Planctomycetota bacterium]|nr:beta-galactosidase [Planctomycetota bacterium]
MYTFSLAPAGTPELLPAVPDVVGEEAFALPVVQNMDKLWQGPADVTVSRFAEKRSGRDVLEIKYWLKELGSRSHLDYILPADRPVAERLRFWIRGDGSGNNLQLLCYHALSRKWISLAEIRLDFRNWRHLEIPASNPIYRYHKTVTAFRFELSANKRMYHFGQCRLLLSGMELVCPKLVTRPAKYKVIPTPAFDTWGAPPRQYIPFGAQMGTTIHMSSVGFPDGGDVAQRTGYAAKAVKWTREAGIMPGISFYSAPTREWMDKHPDLLVKNQVGQRHAAPAAFTSPWNPTARKLWREHIIECLNYLKANDSLRYVQLVELCPGEESIVSFEWSKVWAFDEYAVRAYRNYLRKRYRDDISRLNADWASEYHNFDDILPPDSYYPDRAHWVFADFYRLSMLRYCVFLADSVRKVFTPKYWLWMVHSVGSYPHRFYSARYPLFYTENMRRLGCLDYAQIAALDWQGIEDVQYLQRSGARVIGEIDIRPEPDRLKWTFDQCRKFAMDGVFIGVLEIHSAKGELTPIGRLCRQLIRDFKASPR